MSYEHLSDKERFYMEQRLVEGESIPKIATTLGRHKSSIYREINRNTDKSFGFYSGLRANNIANVRQSSTTRKVKFFDKVSSNVSTLFLNQLEFRSSPEQISFILKDELGIMVSHSTIYKHIKLDNLNNRPRKKLGFITPTQKMVQMLQECL